MHSTPIRFILPIVLTATLAAQVHEARYETRAVSYDSGYLPATARPDRVLLTTVRAPGGLWLRLRFGTLTNLPQGSRLVLTATRDQAVQYFDAISLLDRTPEPSRGSRTRRAPRSDRAATKVGPARTVLGNAGGGRSGPAVATSGRTAP